MYRILIFLLIPTISYSQISLDSNITVSGYVDTYYGYNTLEPVDNNIPNFVSSNRHNELNINLGYLSIKCNNNKVRSNITLSAGTYNNSNYTNEQLPFRNVTELNVGIKLSKKKDIWLDAGIMSSPHTNESIISKDQLLYTRSLAPEFVPYYMSGVRLTVPITHKITGSVAIVNGWQQIVDLNKSKSIVTNLEYKISPKSTLNYDTYIGDERSVYTPNNRMRYFNDLYYIYNPDGKVTVSSCAYIGVQEYVSDTINNERSTNVWYQMNIMAKYNITSTSSLSARLEYFNDQNGAITNTNNFNMSSASICFNKKVYNKVLYRFELREFIDNTNKSSYNTWITNSLSISF